MPTAKIIDDQFKEILRKTRNDMLSSSDKYLLIPDLPEDILDDIKSYREQLRNITTKFGTEWKTEDDINWPEFPQKLMLKPLPLIS